MKVIRKYNSLVEAEGACAFLEAHQIKAVLPDRHALYHQPHLLGIFGGVRLQVNEQDVQIAENLLHEIERKSHLTAVTQDDVVIDEHGQPRYASEQRRKESVKWIARFILIVIALYWAIKYVLKWPI